MTAVALYIIACYLVDSALLCNNLGGAATVHTDVHAAGLRDADGLPLQVVIEHVGSIANIPVCNYVFHAVIVIPQAISAFGCINHSIFLTIGDIAQLRSLVFIYSVKRTPEWRKE